MTNQITLNSTANIRDCMEAIIIDESLLSTVKHMYINSEKDLTTCTQVFVEIELQLKKITINANSTVRRILEDHLLRVLIAIACPHLEQVFITNYDPHEAGMTVEDMYAGITDKMRWQLSTITLLEETRSLEFLTNFPSLEHIYLTKGFNRMLTWLPLFCQNDYTLKSIHGELNDCDVENFEENYLITRGGRDTTAKKLAALETLVIQDHKFCINRIKFFINYVTGIKEFNYTNFNLTGFNQWDYCGFPDYEYYYQKREEQLDMLEEFIDYVADIEVFDVKFLDISMYDIEKSFDSIFAAVFNKTPTDVRHVDGTLKVHMERNPKPNGELKLRSYKLSSHRLCRMVEVKTTEADYFSVINNAIQDALKSVDCDIDTFCCLYSPTCPSEYLDGFQIILEQLPTVNKVSMGVPPDGFTTSQEFVDRDNSDGSAYINRKFRQVKDLELNAATIVTKQLTFNLCISMFPNIKNLRLNYFTGIWSLTRNEYSVPLHKKQIDNLHLDITPAYIKSMVYYGALPLPNDLHLIIHVQVGRKRLCYKVVYAGLQRSKVTTADAKRLAKSSVVVRITAKSINYITLYLNRKPFNNTKKPLLDYFENTQNSRIVENTFEVD